MEHQRHGKPIRYQRTMVHIRIDVLVRKKMDFNVVKWYQEDRIIVNAIQRNKDIHGKQYKKNGIYILTGLSSVGRAFDCSGF